MLAEQILITILILIQHLNILNFSQHFKQTEYLHCLQKEVPIHQKITPRLLLVVEFQIVLSIYSYSMGTLPRRQQEVDGVLQAMVIA